MKIVQHGENLWQLTRLFAFNCYLVREADGLTLIDSGLSGSGNAILDTIEKLGLPLRRIALTHAHSDHAGSLDEVSVRVPEAEVLFSARTAAFLNGELTLLPDEPQYELRGGFVRRETQPTQTIAAGDQVGSLRVLAAPGHSPDQVAFFDERDGTLIAGDAYQTMAGTAVAGTLRWLFPFPAMATWHQATALKSAIALRDMQPSRLAVGHGPILDNPGRKMEEAIDEARRTHNGG